MFFFIMDPRPGFFPSDEQPGKLRELTWDARQTDWVTLTITCLPSTSC